MLNSDLNGWNVLRLEYYFFWFLISFYGKVGLTISFRSDKIAKIVSNGWNILRSVFILLCKKKLSKGDTEYR